MPEYISNGVIYKDGKTHMYGKKLTLSEEEAERLGSKVVPLEVAAPDTPLTEMKVKELRPLAKKAGVEGHSSMDRAELIAALQPLQTEQVNADDEPN